MSTPFEVRAAERIARSAHRRRLSGEPYVEHSARVAAAVGDNHLRRAAAWLHDVLEDTEWTAEDLARLGIGPEVLRVVDALTRTSPSETYREYIQRVIDAGPDAVAVKLADVEDNLSSLPEGHSLRERYEWTLERLRRGR